MILSILIAAFIVAASICIYYLMYKLHVRIIFKEQGLNDARKDDLSENIRTVFFIHLAVQILFFLTCNDKITYGVSLFFGGLSEKFLFILVANTILYGLGILVFIMRGIISLSDDTEKQNQNISTLAFVPTFTMTLSIAILFLQGK